MKRTGGTVVVLVTCPTKTYGQRLAKELVRRRVAACVNIVPIIHSIFWWKGRIDQAREVLLVIKTSAPSFPKLRTLVRRLHPYQVPEIIALPIVRGYAPYLAWVRNTTAPQRMRTHR